MRRDIRLLYYMLKNWLAYSCNLVEPVPIGYVIIGLTYACNARCTMCDIHQLYKENPRLQEEELDLPFLLTRLRESRLIRKISHIDLTGGEPFLKEGLDDFIIGLLDLPQIRIVSLNTNGFLTENIVASTEHVLKNTPPGKIFSISVSIDGIGAVHDIIRGVPHAFDKVEATVVQLKRIRSKFPNFTIRSNAVIQKDNIDSLGAIKEYWKLHGIEGAYAVIQHPFYTSRTQPRQDNNYFSVDAIQKLKAIEPKNKGMNYYLDHGFCRPLPCFAGYAALFIDQCGALYPCNFISGNPAFEMGNIKAESIDSIWRSRKAWQVRGMVKACPYTACWNGCEVDQTMIQHEPIERIAKALSLGFFSYYRRRGLEDFE